MDGREADSGDLRAELSGRLVSSKQIESRAERMIGLLGNKCLYFNFDFN